MLEAALVVLRFAQYTGAAILFGASLFLLYALPRAGELAPPALAWPRGLLVVATLLTLVGAVLGLIVQTATMAGSLTEGLKPAALTFVAGGTGIGRAALFRALAAAVAAVGLLLFRPGAWLWGLLAVLGGVTTASWAWMGHGAATEGAGALVHLAADVVHSLAAGLWLGALPAFLLLLWRPMSIGAAAGRVVHRSLHGFGGIGATAVVALILTGLVNSWYLVGPSNVWTLWASEYGRLLSVKLLLFALMLGLAAANRYRLTPRLEAALATGSAAAAALAALRRSVIVEAGAGLGILALVAWLGTLAPPSGG